MLCYFLGIFHYVSLGALTFILRIFLWLVLCSLSSKIIDLEILYFLLYWAILYLMSQLLSLFIYPIPWRQRASSVLPISERLLSIECAMPILFIFDFHIMYLSSGILWCSSISSSALALWLIQSYSINEANCLAFLVSLSYCLIIYSNVRRLHSSK